MAVGDALRRREIQVVAEPPISPRQKRYLDRMAKRFVFILLYRMVTQKFSFKAEKCDSYHPIRSFLFLGVKHLHPDVSFDYSVINRPFFEIVS